MESAPPSMSTQRFAALNAVISIGAIGFLIWLIYFHEPPPSGTTSSVLPSFNAIFNSTSATLLVLGLRAIRAGKRALHRQLMLGALTASALFLINYVFYHYSQGDTRFLGTGIVRPFYFFLLVSHIILSAVVLPMILTSLYLALTEKIAAHKRFSRWTWGGWMYVSVTGVIIYLMLHVIDWA
jgi:putative membrane protein